MRPIVIALAVAVCPLGCASSSAIHHPSAARYDALAADDEAVARAELTPGTVSSHRQGVCGGGGGTFGGSWETCWTANDDAVRVDAQDHWRRALDEHRAAASLREAEDRACRGLSRTDREISPFAHVKDVVSVAGVRVGNRLVGATVTFRRVPPLTRESLQRIVDCHVAQADAIGHDASVEAFCPLNLPDVRAVVTESAAGFDVTMTSHDEDAAREVLRRSEALVK